MLMTIKLPQFIIDNAADFEGQGHLLESALGAYVLGQLYGWRVLRMLHLTNTYNRYQKALGVDFKEVCPEWTSLSDRVSGIRLAKERGGFWAVAKGERVGRERFQIGNDAQGSLL